MAHKSLSVVLLMAIATQAIAQNSTQINDFTILKAISQPDISHIVDMKAVAPGKVFISYEAQEGRGQRILQEINSDIANGNLSFSQEYGKRDDGSYQLFMPYLINFNAEKPFVVSQDDGELFTINPNAKFAASNKHILDYNFKVPFPVSLYVQDVQMISPTDFLFVGREPNGGKHSVFLSKPDSMSITLIKSFVNDSNYSSWVINTGKLAYSSKAGLCVFAYRLYPTVEFFKPTGEIIKIQTIGQNGFDTTTLEYADLEDYNRLHFMDITQTEGFFYLLYWGKKGNEMLTSSSPSKILKFDHTGNLQHTFILDSPIRKIAAFSDQEFIAWDGNNFIYFSLK